MKREQRREQLLQHARDVFAQKGYHAAKIDDIVAHASVARGTFYLHFDDKRRIFEELVDDFLSRISLAIVRIRVDDGASPPLAQLRENVYRVLDVGIGDPGMTKILLKNAAGLDPDFDRKVRAFYRAIEELLALSLLNGQRMGIVRTGDRRVLGALALGSIKEIGGGSNPVVGRRAHRRGDALFGRWRADSGPARRSPARARGAR
jgi:AcrR family transcriptional regulator